MANATQADLSVSSGVELSSGAANPSRRDFIRRVGGTVFAVTLVDLADPAAVFAATGGCGSGTVDASCDSANDNDANCGSTISGKTTKDSDEGCSTNQKDDNCFTSFNGQDVDEQCDSGTKATGDPDQSCGDCDDNHDSDEHCGGAVPGSTTLDPDSLCGHQHVYGLDPDDVCGTAPGGGTKVEPDAGCGTHKTSYGGSDDDTDEACGKPNADMNCTGQATDATCNTVGNSSTTSPDENCSPTEPDNACSHYDADESCGSSIGGKAQDDEACGITKIGNWYDYTDTDNYCPAPADTNDQTTKFNTNWPIKLS